MVGSAILALLAAIAFAAGPALQQRGALETSARSGDPRFLAQLWSQPIWLLGGIVQAVGWVLQAVALHYGSLVRVQVLTTLSLVFALPFGAWLTDQRITRTVWLGAVAVIQDLTAAKSLREKQDLLERAAFWSDLAASMSHEIRNPLVAIKTFAQLLPERFDDADFRQPFNPQVVADVPRDLPVNPPLEQRVDPGNDLADALDALLAETVFLRQLAADLLPVGEGDL